MRLSLVHAPKWMRARTVNSLSALGQFNGTCRFHASNKRQKVLSVDNMNPFVKNMEYAVRGPIVIRAGEIEEELKKVHSYRYLLCNLMPNFNTDSMQLSILGSFNFKSISRYASITEPQFYYIYIYLSPCVQNPV